MANLNQRIPNLEVLPVDHLVPHEHMDEQRARPLMRALEKQNILKNPPVVAPLDETRYVVLDGANRTTAFRLLGIPHIVAQVVENDSGLVQTETWSHVLLESSGEEIFMGLHRVEGVEVAPAPNAPIESMLAEQALVVLDTPREGLFQIVAEYDGLNSKIRQLNRVVDSYKEHSRLERTSARGMEGLAEIYEGISGLVIFPSFIMEDVLQVAGDGGQFPPGITRFIISPRALRINYPLDQLASDKPLEKKQAKLRKRIKRRILDRRVRYYRESTYLYDE